MQDISFTLSLCTCCQEFVFVPTARLKEPIKQLCEQHGIRFVETEESYTSKASFLDGDFLPVFGLLPEGWKPSGRRVKRGMYRTKNGQFVNADANGAANFLAFGTLRERKVEIQLGLNLSLAFVGRLRSAIQSLSLEL